MERTSNQRKRTKTNCHQLAWVGAEINQRSINFGYRPGVLFMPNNRKQHQANLTSKRNWQKGAGPLQLQGTLSQTTR